MRLREGRQEISRDSIAYAFKSLQVRNTHPTTRWSSQHPIASSHAPSPRRKLALVSRQRSTSMRPAAFGLRGVTCLADNFSVQELDAPSSDFVVPALKGD